MQVVHYLRCPLREACGDALSNWKGSVCGNSVRAGIIIISVRTQRGMIVRISKAPASRPFTDGYVVRCSVSGIVKLGLTRKSATTTHFFPNILTPE